MPFCNVEIEKISHGAKAQAVYHITYCPANDHRDSNRLQPGVGFQAALFQGADRFRMRSRRRGAPPAMRKRAEKVYPVT